MKAKRVASVGNRTVLISVIFLGLTFLLRIQAQSNSGSSAWPASPSDSVVRVVADAQGLAQVAPADLPIHGGTYWWVMPGGSAVPAPCLPLDLSGAIYQMTESQFLVDETGGQVMVSAPRSRLQAQSTSSAVASAVASEAESVVNLITEVQMAAVTDPPIPGDGSETNSDGDYYASGYQAQVFTTNDLWLQMVGTTNTGTSLTAYLVIHPPWNVANGVWDLFGTTNLAPTAWQWVLRCAPGQTNLTVTNLSSPTGFFLLASTNDADADSLSDAFERLVSHTDPTLYSTDGSGMSDGWQWQSFGSISNSPSGDPDGDGLTTIQEWQMRTAGYNPAVFDTNTNLVSDGYEDYSGDGLANLMKSYFGGSMMTSNPSWKVDTDGDGLPELYEGMAGSGGTGLPGYSKNPVP